MKTKKLIISSVVAALFVAGLVLNFSISDNNKSEKLSFIKEAQAHTFVEEGNRQVDKYTLYEAYYTWIDHGCHYYRQVTCVNYPTRWGKDCWPFWSYWDTSDDSCQ